MNTVAKFVCTSISKRKGWGNGPEFVYDASLTAVSGGPTASEENKQFFASTPNGVITLGTVREDHFEVGASYTVAFTLVEPAIAIAA